MMKFMIMKYQKLNEITIISLISCLLTTKLANDFDLTIITTDADLDILQDEDNNIDLDVQRKII